MDNLSCNAVVEGGGGRGKMGLGWGDMSCVHLTYMLVSHGIERPPWTTLMEEGHIWSTSIILGVSSNWYYNEG